jgi:hypothetical protein
MVTLPRLIIIIIIIIIIITPMLHSHIHSSAMDERYTVYILRASLNKQQKYSYI